ERLELEPGTRRCTPGPAPESVAARVLVCRPLRLAPYAAARIRVRAVERVPPRAGRRGPPVAAPLLARRGAGWARPVLRPSPRARGLCVLCERILARDHRHLGLLGRSSPGAHCARRRPAHRGHAGASVLEPGG